MDQVAHTIPHKKSIHDGHRRENAAGFYRAQQSRKKSCQGENSAIIPRHWRGLHQIEGILQRRPPHSDTFTG